ncbi:hypothetical protein CNEO4_640078 [Clostridium neonatale]|nr:hypothetical protein CNEO4_640078 [Clostridium neonatale]CAI3702094.1 hypothetical protein CNEO4_660077 [Clostridium neonatale]CAI3706336.1 hypothetical protein CNEO2_670014 [Clostridium neonatale]CAI4141369.1 hypothetical protein CNEO4_670078 [Clostridium neonatale]
MTLSGFAKCFEMSDFIYSLNVTEDDRKKLSLTHLRGAGIEYISKRHVGNHRM